MLLCLLNSKLFIKPTIVNRNHCNVNVLQTLFECLTDIKTLCRSLAPLQKFLEPVKWYSWFQAP